MITALSSDDPRSISTLIGGMAGALRHGGAILSEGDIAALRRMDPRRPPAAFFKITSVMLDEVLGGDQMHESLETRWASIIVGLAHLGDLHRFDIRLGTALGQAKFSELRFSRLLRADVSRLVDELPTLARFLSAKSVPADWTDAARLILSADRRDEETTRRKLAKDYYRALASMATT